MSAGEPVGAIVLLRTTRSKRDMVRVFGAMQGVSRAEPVQGPYDFVIVAADAAQVDVIERLPEVTAAEVCWLSHSRGGGRR
ncbi:MAG: Lrp/AsnC family transcriptional regulator [Actinomycetota bacterium]|nr:Lrp/AsnC family transcriptional regulator [Actinomycetota bacterium]